MTFPIWAEATSQQCDEGLWRRVPALPPITPFTTVATTIVRMANVPPDIRANLLQGGYGSSFWMAPVGAAATAARPQDLRVLEAAVKDQRGVLALPSWGQTATG